MRAAQSFARVCFAPDPSLLVASSLSVLSPSTEAKVWICRTHAALIFTGVVDALPQLLELEAAATAGHDSSDSMRRTSPMDTDRRPTTMLLLNMCGSGSQEGLDAVLRTVRTFYARLLL